MSEARLIELAPIAEKFGGLDLVVISPNDPEAMLRHTQECRDRGYPFVADPSQQLARMEGPAIRQLIEGAALLFTNDYEKALIEKKTGWTDAEVLARVGVRITTLGADGVIVERAGEPPSMSLPSLSSSVPIPPASATASGPDSLPASRGASTSSAARRSARYSPPTCWRRSVPRSTRSSRPISTTDSPAPSATPPPLKSTHLAASEV